MTNAEIETRIRELDAAAAVSDPGNRKAGQAFALAQQLAERTGETVVDVLARLTPFSAPA